MAADNFSEKRGLPYGVFDGREAPFLMDDITDSGESLAMDGWRSDVKAALENALSGLANADGILDELVEMIQENEDNHFGMDFQEEEFDYTDEDTAYHLGYLGGAPLIWTCESNFAMHCHACSPCVPGAGDLDSPAKWGLGILALCPPPEDWQEVADETGKVYWLLNLDTMEKVEVKPGHPDDEPEGE